MREWRGWIQGLRLARIYSRAKVSRNLALGDASRGRGVSKAYSSTAEAKGDALLLDPDRDRHGMAGELCETLASPCQQNSWGQSMMFVRRTGPTILANGDLALVPAKEIGPLLAGAVLLSLKQAKT